MFFCLTSYNWRNAGNPPAQQWSRPIPISFSSSYAHKKYKSTRVPDSLRLDPVFHILRADFCRCANGVLQSGRESTTEAAAGAIARNGLLVKIPLPLNAKSACQDSADLETNCGEGTAGRSPGRSPGCRAGIRYVARKNRKGQRTGGLSVVGPVFGQPRHEPNRNGCLHSLPRGI